MKVEFSFCPDDQQDLMSQHVATCADLAKITAFIISFNKEWAKDGAGVYALQSVQPDQERLITVHQNDALPKHAEFATCLAFLTQTTVHTIFDDGDFVDHRFIDFDRAQHQLKKADMSAYKTGLQKAYTVG